MSPTPSLAGPAAGRAALGYAALLAGRVECLSPGDRAVGDARLPDPARPGGRRRGAAARPADDLRPAAGPPGTALVIQADPKAATIRYRRGVQARSVVHGHSSQRPANRSGCDRPPNVSAAPTPISMPSLPNTNAEAMSDSIRSERMSTSTFDGAHRPAPAAGRPDVAERSCPLDTGPGSPSDPGPDRRLGAGAGDIAGQSRQGRLRAAGFSAAQPAAPPRPHHPRPGPPSTVGRGRDRSRARHPGRQGTSRAARRRARRLQHAGGRERRWLVGRPSGARAGRRWRSTSTPTLTATES